MQYETEVDRLNEERVALEWAKYRSVTAIRIKVTDDNCKPRIDRAIQDPVGEIMGFAEVKTCGWPFAAPSFNGGYKIQVDKITAMTEVAFAFSLPTWLVVEFTDALAWLKMNDARKETHDKMRRRYTLSRPERGVTKEAVLFPWAEFTIDRMVSEPSITAAAPAEHHPRPPPDRSTEVAQF